MTYDGGLQECDLTQRVSHDPQLSPCQTNDNSLGKNALLQVLNAPCVCACVCVEATGNITTSCGSAARRWCGGEV